MMMMMIYVIFINKMNEMLMASIQQYDVELMHLHKIKKNSPEFRLTKEKTKVEFQRRTLPVSGVFP